MVDPNKSNNTHTEHLIILLVSIITLRTIMNSKQITTEKYDSSHPLDILVQALGDYVGFGNHNKNGEV